MAGSIGVIATHTDQSGADAQAGLKRTEVVAGKLKNAASSSRPLDSVGAAAMQETVDYIYSLFVEAVASNRGATVDKVLAGMADGRIFIGQQAVTAGLVDGVMSLDALVTDLAANPARYASRGRAPAAPTTSARAAAVAAIPATSKAFAMKNDRLNSAPHPPADPHAEAAKSALAVYARSTGSTKVTTDARERVLPVLLAGAARPDAEARRDTDADAARAEAQRAAAEAAVALFNKVNNGANRP